MKLDQIFYVLEIEKTGSFSQAARNLYLSQPNLSYSVKQLEAELGFEIFERKSTGIVTTPQGRELLTHFQIIQQEYDSISRIKESEETPSRILLRVGTLNTTRVPSVILPIVKRYQDTPINFTLTNYTEFTPLFQHLQTCKIDFAFLGIINSYLPSMKALMKNNGIEYHAIKKIPLCAAVGMNSPFYYAETLSIEELYPYTIVSYEGPEKDSSFSLTVASGLENKVHGCLHVNSSNLFFQLIRDTSCIGLIAASPQAETWKELSDIHMIALSGTPVTVELAWIKLRRFTLTTIMEEILDSFIKSC